MHIPEQLWSDTLSIRLQGDWACALLSADVLNQQWMERGYHLMWEPHSKQPENSLAHTQVLYQYPEGKTITPDMASFCFPHGVQPVLLERTPSNSALNEILFSQQYQHSDSSSFIFSLKVRHPHARMVKGMDWCLSSLLWWNDAFANLLTLLALVCASRPALHASVCTSV